MGYSRISAERDLKYARIGSVAAVAAIILAGCGGGSHSGSGTSSGSGASAPPTSAAAAFDLGHIQTAAAHQIEADHQGKLLQGQTRVMCPAGARVEPKAGTKFDCSINAMPTRGADSFTGNATVVLNDAAGKQFSLDYKMSNMPLPGQGPKLTLSGTDSSVG